MFHHNFEFEEKEIREEIKKHAKIINSYPTGNIHCNKNGKYYKHFLSSPKGLSYIPAKNKQLIGNLVQKRYHQAIISDLRKELTAIETYKNLMSCANEVENLLSDSHISSIFNDSISHEEDWSHSSYPPNTNHPETLIHKSMSGNILRSKSEVIIDMALFMHQISYRYECELPLGNHLLYPDFTIKHPLNDSLYYWEHFGMMDNADYVRDYLWKMDKYLNHNIIPGIHLITTYETKEHPLSADEVEHLIRHYFT